MQNVHDRVADAHRRIEGSDRILRDVGDDLAAKFPQRLDVTPDEIDPRDRDRSRPDDDPRSRVPEQCQRSGCLSAARLAHETEDLAGPHCEAHVFDDRLSGRQAEGELVDADDRWAGLDAHAATLREVRGTYDLPRLR